MYVLHVYIYTRIFSPVEAYIYIHVYYTHYSTHTHIHTHTHRISSCINCVCVWYTNIHTHIHCTYIHVHTHVHNTFIRIYTHTKYTYTYLQCHQVHVYTCMWTCIRTCTCLYHDMTSCAHPLFPTSCARVPVHCFQHHVIVNYIVSKTRLKSWKGVV